MKFIKRLFCTHTYTKSVSCDSERVGCHNYIYDYEHYKCEKCGDEFKFKIFRNIDKYFYLRNSVKIKL